MFMVHAKLAVLTVKMAGMERKMDDLLAAHERRLPTCAVHEAKLETLARQLDDVQERLRHCE
jgi:hypothetical protein